MRFLFLSRAVDLFLDVVVNRTAQACFLVIVGFYASAALAASVASDPAGSFDVNTSDALLQALALHATSIAVIIRALVRFARSDVAGDVWGRVPVRYRPAVLAALGVAAVVFEHVALGEPWAHSIFVAIGGVGGAVTSHEMQERVASKPAPALPTA